MLLLIFMLITFQVDVEAYGNTLFNLVSPENNISGCGGFTDYPRPVIHYKHMLAEPFTDFKKSTLLEVFTFSTVAKPKGWEPDPLQGFQSTINKVLFGEQIESEDKSDAPDATKDALGIYPSGQIMRAEMFQNRSMVHLPPTEWIHPGHSYLNTSTPDFMQTAVNAFSILLDGSLSDVLRLPSTYVLRSSRTIAMMKITREKLVATWRVVKGDLRTDKVTIRTLEYYRPLFKYLNGREMSKLNLSDDRILSYIGTHADLNRHQVGVIASEFIRRNKRWNTPRYLNLMNNLICGIPMMFMRNLSENVFLQLSHEIFYHIKACVPMQKRFYLSMMTRTQVLGRSNSWGARDVARLGLLLTEVDGPELSAINPEAMAGISPQVMMKMSTNNLKYLTETQVRHLARKPLNILTMKLHTHFDKLRMMNLASKLGHNFMPYLLLSIKLLV